MHLHYGYSGAPDQLTGEYTIPAETFAFAPAEESAPAENTEVQSVTIVSDDEGTKMTFNSDGTYRFDFEAYSIVDEGTYTYEGGVLTVKDANGVEYTAEGDPMHLHYGYSGAPDQLTGEYTIPAETFAFAEAAAEETEELLAFTVLSDDEATEMTFYPDNTYRFYFSAYDVEDLGTYTLENGVLTVVNANGLEMSPQNGILHYVSSINEGLVGNFPVDADNFNADAAGDREASLLEEWLSSTKTKIVCIGDSITYGAGVSATRETESYEAFLQNLLGDEYLVLNFGVSGSTMMNSGDKPYREQPSCANAFRIDADILILMLGTNDSKDINWPGNDGAYRNDYVSFLTDYQAEHPETKIVLMQPPMCFPDDRIGGIGFGISNDVIRDEIYGIVADISEEFNCTLIDLYSLTENHPEWFEDGIHPNAAGNEVIANYICEKLTEAELIQAVAISEPVEVFAVTSDDEATTITFYDDGSYRFFFEAYQVEDIGTWTYDGETLIVVNANGVEASASGSPLKLHYVTAVSEQLTGDYTIDFAAPAESADSQPKEATAVYAITSDDAATTITFYDDGSYRFFFESYNVEDIGTWTYDGETLTLVNANGAEASASGSPLKLHYVTAVSEQLTGDYTIDFSAPAAPAGEEPAAEAQSKPASSTPVVTGSIFDGPVNVPSGDGSTYMVFNADGVFQFRFDEYNIVDEGSYTFEDGVLTLTDPLGKVYTAEGDPMSFTYAYSAYESLTGDFTVPASVFAESAELSVFDGPVTLTSSGENATTMTFNADGTYLFAFAEYNINDPGTYTYENGVLTLTDANGKEYVVDGDPISLTYAYSAYEMLTGEFSFPASIFSPSGANRLVGAFTVTGENRPALLEFRLDGTYFFNYEQYGLEEEGRYSFSNGALKLTNEKNVASTAEGETLALDYQTAISDMLVIHYSIPASSFDTAPNSDGGAATFTSEGENATTMTFNADGTYLFAFAEYNIEDRGFYTYENGVLTLTDANGKEYTAEGDPLSLHYAYSAYDMLTGNFTIPAKTFAG